MLRRGTLKTKTGLIPLNQCPHCGYLVMQVDMIYRNAKPVICKLCDRETGLQDKLLEHILRVIPDPEKVTDICWDEDRLHFTWHTRRFIATPRGAVVDLNRSYPSPSGLLLQQLLKLTKEDAKA